MDLDPDSVITPQPTPHSTRSQSKSRGKPWQRSNSTPLVKPSEKRRNGTAASGSRKGLGETHGSIVSVNSAQVDNLIKENLRDTTYTFDESNMPKVKTARSGRFTAEERDQNANAACRNQSKKEGGLGDTRMSGLTSRSRVTGLGDTRMSGISEISRVSGISGWTQMGNTERAKHKSIKIFDRK